MAVIYRGTLDGLGGASGMMLQTGLDATIGAITFDQPFLTTPAIFCVPTADELIYVKSSATTGFTPTVASATSSGSGTTCNYIAIGRGDKAPAGRLFSNQLGGLDYGACTIDSALTFSYGAYNSIPTVFASPISDEGLYIASDTTTGFTPTEATGAGGSGSTANYISIGSSNHHTSLRHTGAAKTNVGGDWIEVGTGTIGSAVTFAFPFMSTPIVLCCPTSDNMIYAASSATTGFTPTGITLSGGGSGTSCVYMAIGPKAL